MIVTVLVNLRLGGRCIAVKFVSMFDAVFPLQKEFQDRYRPSAAIALRR